MYRMCVWQEHLNLFSCEGLRVLVLAEKSIPEAEYEAWVKVYAEPSRATHRSALCP